MLAILALIGRRMPRLNLSLDLVPIDLARILHPRSSTDLMELRVRPDQLLKEMC
jgi:hypothetical protein